MELIEKLENLMVTLKEDSIKFFEKGNKSAGVRTRKGAQEMKNALQDLRKEVLNPKKN
jgi:exonuclease VII small subunit|tara:strand:- start:2950 stop:3123 length:174 start_codon:yes stop_codon:yes gene_type:complete